MEKIVMKDEKTSPVVARDATGRWLPRKSPNPAGRGMTNRQRISERLLADLAAVWETHGESVLQRLAATDPGKLATIAYGLLPKDVFISVAPTTPGSLSADEWRMMIDLVRLIQANAPVGAKALPEEIIPTIEDALRAHFAQPIEN